MSSSKAVDDLVAGIENRDEKVRTKAWLGADKVGAAAIGPLAAVMKVRAKELEVARAAKNGLWRIARAAGRPGAETEKKAVVAELIGVLAGDQPAAVRREVLWMLSEIGADESVAPIARSLSSRGLREDARCALERLPGAKATAALKAALAAAPEDFKANIAQSLRARGVAVGAPPCRKLVPTRKTRVKAAK